MGKKCPQHNWKSQTSLTKCNHKFVNMNAKMNFQMMGPRNEFWSCHNWWDVGKHKRLEGQKCFLTASDSADSANVWLRCTCTIIFE